MKQKSRTKKNPYAKEMDLHTLQATPPWDWPATAAQTFKAVLTNPAASVSDRLIAAELAGDYVAINDELAETLMSVLGSASESDALRAQAAISFGAALESCDMGEFDDPYDTPPISETMFEKIKRLLHLLYHEENVPKLVRRRILEASVRAQEKWHHDAIQRAYASKDPEWVLTAVFCMQYVKGFDKEILESLESKDQEIHKEAVEAAGAKEVNGAWKHVYKLVENADSTPKPLLLAAIAAVANIRQDTPSLEILKHLVDSEDSDVSEAAGEALSMAGAYTAFDEDDFDDESDASGWIN